MTPTPPSPTTLRLELHAGACHVTLNRPDRKNAMSGTMLDELLAAFEWINREPEVRLLILRGAGGTFCAGADLKELREHHGVRAGEEVDESAARRTLSAHNLRFGLVSRAADMLDVPTIAVVEGAALGGGFGLACVSDIVLAQQDAVFGLPETRLGLVPAQIAPFVIQRIGAMATRRLALTGARFNAIEAARLGLVDGSFPDVESLNQAVADTTAQILRCGPRANRVTKRLLRRLSPTVSDHTLDQAAHLFSVQSLSPEGQEGTAAFNAKRNPAWAPQPPANKAG